MAIGGSVNLVNRQPTTGPIQNELDLSADSLGTFRSHYGSGGSTTVPGLDYRVDYDRIQDQQLHRRRLSRSGGLLGATELSREDGFKTFVAVEYKKDDGHAYWGTPLVPTSFAGSHAVNGVVSGNMRSARFPATISGR